MHDLKACILGVLAKGLVTWRAAKAFSSCGFAAKSGGIIRKRFAGVISFVYAFDCIFVHLQLIYVMLFLHFCESPETPSTVVFKECQSTRYVIRHFFSGVVRTTKLIGRSR